MYRHPPVCRWLRACSFHEKNGGQVTWCTGRNTRSLAPSVLFTLFCARFVACLSFDFPVLKGQAAAVASAATSAQVRAHVPVPSQEKIKEAILKRKKVSLLKRLEGGEEDLD